MPGFSHRIPGAVRPGQGIARPLRLRSGATTVTVGHSEQAFPAPGCPPKEPIVVADQDFQAVNGLQMHEPHAPGGWSR